MWGPAFAKISAVLQPSVAPVVFRRAGYARMPQLARRRVSPTASVLIARTATPRLGFVGADARPERSAVAARALSAAARTTAIVSISGLTLNASPVPEAFVRPPHPNRPISYPASTLMESRGCARRTASVLFDAPEGAPCTPVQQKGGGCQVCDRSKCSSAPLGTGQNSKTIPGLAV